MRIVSYDNKPDSRPREHINAPIDPARITVLADQIVIGFVTPTDEWRIELNRKDVGVLGGALSRLTGSRPTD